jgi:hypothetical protein
MRVFAQILRECLQVQGLPLPEAHGFYEALGDWAEAAGPGPGPGDSAKVARLCRLLDGAFVCPGLTSDDLLDLLSIGALDPFSSEAKYQVCDMDFGGRASDGRPYRRTIRSKRCERLLPPTQPGTPGPRKERCDGCRLLGSHLGRLRPRDAAHPASYFERLHRRTLVKRAEKTAAKITDLTATIARKERKVEALMREQGRPVDEQLETLLSASLKGQTESTIVVVTSTRVLAQLLRE